MDVLSDILSSIHLTGGVRFRCELSAPWGMQMPESPAAEFHVIVRGNCWLRMPGRREPVALQGGDFVALLRGTSHRLSDSLRGPSLPAAAIVGDQDLSNFGPVVHGGGGQPATILCGYFEFDRDTLHPIVSALPSIIHLRGTDNSEFVWLKAALEFMIHETRGARPGSEAVVNRLAGVLFVQMVRAYMEQAPKPPPILAAIADRHIGAALSRMHAAPDEAWTLASLAAACGLSRSALAARFLELVGRTPMQYLTLWRMQRARELLASSHLSTGSIAERVGYQSDIAFAKAFKRITGVGPGAFRRSRPKPD